MPPGIVQGEANCETTVKFNLRSTDTMVEWDARDTVRDVHGGEAGAAGECALVDARDTVRDGHGEDTFIDVDGNRGVFLNTFALQGRVEVQIIIAEDDPSRP